MTLDEILESTDPDDFYSVPNLPQFAWCEPPPPLDPLRWPAAEPGFFNWLTADPVCSILGGTEPERTHEAAALLRYWIDKARVAPGAIPDPLRFYFDDAVSLMLEFRKAQYRDEDGSNIVNIVTYTKYLTLTEVHRLDPKDHALVESLIRKRRNAGKFTVLTAAGGAPGGSEGLVEIIREGRTVKLA